MSKRDEGIEFEPHYAATDDGYCDWVSPLQTGYLMQCCDCKLVHEVDFRVAKFEPRPSEEFTVVDDIDIAAQFRMRRRDDLPTASSSARAALRELSAALVRAYAKLNAAEQEDFWPQYAEHVDAAKAILAEAISRHTELKPEAVAAMQRLADADAELGLSYD